MAVTESDPKAIRAAVLHRVIHRLHFYAGLVVAPFVLILALTGAIYLFNTEIEDFMHPDWRFATQAGPHVRPEQMVAGALSAYPGATPTRIDLPTAANRTAVVFLTPQQGGPLRVYVDPVSGKAKGSFIYENTLVGFADVMHGSLMLGDIGDNIVELAACWAILMVGSGLFLWWPRGATRLGGVLFPRLNLPGRAFWRDLHAVTGAWSALLILFLLLTGLPWANVWGGNLNKAMAAVGLGYPASYRTHDTAHLAHSKTSMPMGKANPGVPWTLETAPSPHSAMVHDMSVMAPISIGEAARIFEDHGLRTAYRLVYPKNADDVFTAYTYPDQPEGQRTVHLDQYSGAVLNDVTFANYGLGAKAVELGVQLHMGNYFGLANQLLMLVAALGSAALAVTGPILWLKRRKTGLGAPPNLPDAKAGVAFFAGLAVLGILFPLMGLSIVLVLTIERLVLSRAPAVRTWMGLA